MSMVDAFAPHRCSAMLVERCIKAFALHRASRRVRLLRMASGPSAAAPLGIAIHDRARLGHTVPILLPM